MIPNEWMNDTLCMFANKHRKVPSFQRRMLSVHTPVTLHTAWQLISRQCVAAQETMSAYFELAVNAPC